MAIQNDIDPDMVRAVGRWKSCETFEFHYIHSRPKLSFVDQMLRPNSLDFGK